MKNVSNYDNELNNKKRSVCIFLIFCITKNIFLLLLLFDPFIVILVVKEEYKQTATADFFS